MYYSFAVKRLHEFAAVSKGLRESKSTRVATIYPPLDRSRLLQVARFRFPGSRLRPDLERSNPICLVYVWGVRTGDEPKTASGSSGEPRGEQGDHGGLRGVQENPRVPRGIQGSLGNGAREGQGSPGERRGTQGRSSGPGEGEAKAAQARVDDIYARC